MRYTRFERCILKTEVIYYVGILEESPVGYVFGV
jgi:hypothetical protein